MSAIQSGLSVKRHALVAREYEKTLIVSLLFSIALILARMGYTGKIFSLFMIWNLFLGSLPYLITRTMSREPKWAASKLNFVIAFLLWLFWVPNSFYIITDLFHLHQNPDVPHWYDLALYMSCAWNGLLMGLLSVRQMEKLWMVRFPKLRDWWFIAPVMFLNAWGVYIGRFLRFNTWDLIANPFQLLTDIFPMLLHPMENKYAWGMVLCFSVMMTLMYVTLKQLSRAIR